MLSTTWCFNLFDLNPIVNHVTKTWFKNVKNLYYCRYHVGPRFTNLIKFYISLIIFSQINYKFELCNILPLLNAVSFFLAIKQTTWKHILFYNTAFKRIDKQDHYFGTLFFILNTFLKKELVWFEYNLCAFLSSTDETLFQLITKNTHTRKGFIRRS